MPVPFWSGVYGVVDSASSSASLLSSLEVSDTKVYDPLIRALLRTASHICEVVVLKSFDSATSYAWAAPGRKLVQIPETRYLRLRVWELCAQHSWISCTMPVPFCFGIHGLVDNHINAMV